MGAIVIPTKSERWPLNLPRIASIKDFDLYLIKKSTRLDGSSDSVNNTKLTSIIGRKYPDNRYIPWEATLPAEVRLEYVDSVEILGYSFLQAQEGAPNSWIVEKSNDGTSWEFVEKINRPFDTEEIIRLFPESVKDAKFLRFRFPNDHSEYNFIRLSGIRIITRECPKPEILDNFGVCHKLSSI